MIITCPNCSTKYNLDDSLVKPLSKARCKFCGHVFVLVDGLDKDSLDHLGDTAAPQTEAAAATVSESDLKVSLDAQTNDKPRKRSKAPFLLLFLFLLLAAAGAAYMGYLPATFDIAFLRSDVKKDTKPLLTTPEGQNATAAEEPENNEKNFAFQEVRQFYVNNEKAGQLFIIEGKVVNKFTSDRELIRIEASLLDEAGTQVLAKEQFCGVVLSMFQLQVLSEPELDKALNNNIEILTNNTAVPPGGTVPFMVVFTNVPPTVREFMLKVIDAKHSPKPAN